MEKQETNISRAIIMQVMKESGMTQQQLAPLVGMKGQRNVSAALQHDMKVSLFIKMLDAMGYEIVVQKKAVPLRIDIAEDVGVKVRK